MRTVRTYSAHTMETLTILGNLIRVTRKEQKIPASGLAERAGISRGTLIRIESGDPRCEIGLVFEVASILGIELFGSEIHRSTISSSLEAKLNLLPLSVHRPKLKVPDAF